MLDALPLYLVLGAIAGVIAGLLGVGGGLIIVPALTLLFMHSGILVEGTVQFAVGTSLATIVFTSLSSVRAHHRRGAVRWDIVSRLAPGLVAGTLAGALLASRLGSSTLGMIFGVFEILIAVHMALDLKAAPARRLPKTAGMLTTGTGIGGISALLGIGGGTLTVPFLVWCNVTMREAVATSSASGLPIALMGAVGFMAFGVDAPPHAWATGYVYWPAVAGIATASVMTAPAGAWLAHRLPATTLRRVFSAVLLVLGIRMLLA